MKRNIVCCLAVLVLAACGSSAPEVKPRYVSTFQTEETGPMMTYQDFREYSDLKAKRLGGAEYEQRLAERADGNHALHKRFFMLDRNHDGKLSFAELGGMN